MTGIKAAVQKAAPGNQIALYELDATEIGGDLMRFTNDVIGEGQPIVFNGNAYTPLPVKVEGFEWSGRGASARPTLSVSSANKAIYAAVISLGDLAGARFTRIRTFRQFLDDGEEADPGQIIGPDIYVLERKTQQNPITIEWEMKTLMDQEGVQLPRRVVVRDYCSHVYRVFDPETGEFDYTKATCPYVGEASFDAQEQIVSNRFDRCSKQLSGCRARFGQNGVLPTRAFPGVARVRV